MGPGSRPADACTKTPTMAAVCNPQPYSPYPSFSVDSEPLQVFTNKLSRIRTTFGFLTAQYRSVVSFPRPVFKSLWILLEDTPEFCLDLLISIPRFVTDSPLRPLRPLLLGCALSPAKSDENPLWSLVMISWSHFKSLVSFLHALL